MRVNKRDEIVQKALKIFYRDGFHATGMDRLVKETGISKTSMYKHFRTKDDLILATLRLRDELFRNKIIRRIEEITSDPKEQLTALFTALDEWFFEPDFRGCMFIKASGEYPVRGTPIHNSTAEHKQLLHIHFEEVARKAGAPDPAALARKILLLKEGAIVMAHIKGPEGVAKDALEAAELLVAAEFSRTD